MVQVARLRKSSMKLSPLQLEHSVIDEVSIIPAKGTKDFAEELNIQTAPGFARHMKDSSRWQVALAILISGTGDKPAPYDVRIGLMGWFRVNGDGLDEQQQLDILAVNAPSILYSTAREVVAGFTARSINGLFLLPSVSFAGTRVSLPGVTPDAAVATPIVAES